MVEKSSLMACEVHMKNEKPYETNNPEVLCRICGQAAKLHTTYDKEVIETHTLEWNYHGPIRYETIRAVKCPEKSV